MEFEIYQTGNSFYSNKKEALNLASKSFIGEIKSGKVLYSPYEVLYLLEARKAVLLRGSKKISFSELSRKYKGPAYIAFRDLKNKGYVPKEGLKFGADFRVYKKGDSPGKAHAKYLLYAISSREKISPHDFAAKARIAHSTNKALLMAIVDSEEDVSYYEVNWKSKD